MGALDQSPPGSTPHFTPHGTPSFPFSLLPSQKRLFAPSRGVCTAIRCAAALLILLDIVLSSSLLAAPLLMWRGATSAGPTGVGHVTSRLSDAALEDATSDTAMSDTATSAESIILDTPGEVLVVRMSLLPEEPTAGRLSRKLRIFGALEALKHPSLLPSAADLQPLLTQGQQWVAQAHRALTEEALGLRMNTLFMPQPRRQHSQALSQPRLQEESEAQGELQRQAEEVATETPGQPRAAGLLRSIQMWDSDDMPLDWQQYWAGVHPHK